MSNLWGLLTTELGSAFCRQYGDAGGPVFLVWAKDLSNFTEAQLIQGLASFKASNSTYMSLNVFRNHCKPSAADFGLDSFESAYHKIIDRAWEELHPAFHKISVEKYKTTVMVRQYLGDDPTTAPVYKNARKLKHQIGFLNSMKDFDSRRVVKKLFDEVVKRVSEGETFERLILVTDQSGKKNPNWQQTDTMKTAMGNILGMVGSRKARD